MNFTRRSFLSAAAGAPLLAQAPGPKPSFILIIAGDLPAWALGCYGNREIRTPNIDRIAQTGSRLANHFAAAPAAAAGRATLLSGRTPAQHAVHGPDGSLAREVLLSEALSAGGYQSTLIGPWDIGGSAPAHGFAHLPADSLDSVTRAAGEFLDRQAKGKPFFLTLAYPGPGSASGPAAARHQAMYANVTFDSFGIEPVAENARAGRERLANPLASLRRYAAAVTALDDQIPALQRKLVEKDLFGDTVLIFTSDTGALLGRHGLWGDGLASDPVNMFDEVLHTPMLWQWAGRLPGYSTRPELVGAYDFLQTVCEVAGVEPPAGKRLCGRSYLPLLMNQPLPKKEPWDNTVFAQFRDVEMVRDNYYKLVVRGNGAGPNELYAIRRDPRERVNRHDEPGFVTVRAEMARQLAEWQRKLA